MSEWASGYWSGFISAALIAWWVYLTFGTVAGRRMVRDAIGFVWKR